MTGHEQLLSDLKGLLDLARAFEFHDFKNRKFAKPKHELARRLERLADKVHAGAYDNEDTDEADTPALGVPF